MGSSKEDDGDDAKKVKRRNKVATVESRSLVTEYEPPPGLEEAQYQTQVPVQVPYQSSGHDDFEIESDYDSAKYGGSDSFPMSELDEQNDVENYLEGSSNDQQFTAVYYVGGDTHINIWKFGHSGANREVSVTSYLWEVNVTKFFLQKKIAHRAKILIYLKADDKSSTKILVAIDDFKKWFSIFNSNQLTAEALSEVRNEEWDNEKFSKRFLENLTTLSVKKNSNVTGNNFSYRPNFQQTSSPWLYRFPMRW